MRPKSLNKCWKKKKVVSTAVNKSINKTLNEKQKKSDSFNLNKINTPKTNTSIHNFNSSLIPGQKKKKRKIPLTSEKPTTKGLQCQSNIDEINCKESFSNSEQGLEIELPEESNSDVYVISHNNVNYVVNKNELSNKSFLQLLSSDSDVPMKQSTPTSLKVEQNVKKRVPKAIPRMQKLPNGKYKMVPPHIKEPVDFVSLRQSPKFGDTDQDKISLLDANKQNKEVSPEKSSWDTSIDFIDKKNKKKPIPHTATSRDVIKNHDPSEDYDIKLKNEEKCMLSKFIQPSPNSKSLILSGSRTEENTNIINLDNEIIELDTDDTNNSYTTISSDEMNEPSEENSVQKEINVKKTAEENSDNLEGLSSEDISKEQKTFSEQEEKTKSGHFVCCAFHYCDTLVHEPELVSNLYCSSTCEGLDSKHRETLEELKNKEIQNPTKKAITEYKELLNKSKSRRHKRKQLLTFSRPEKFPRNNDLEELEHFNNSCNEPPINEIQSLSNSKFRQISSPEEENDDENGYEDDDDDCLVDDDDDDDNYLDPKTLRNKEQIRKYLNDIPFIPASKKLFDQPFPTTKNDFRVGQKLEGVDPEHEALFCVMTVVEVCGYRIKLHFDGYSDNYNFWVNANCPDLFYPRWCEQNLRTIQPPKNYENRFDWSDYLKITQALPAPKWIFASTSNLLSCTKNKFQIGNKLEALDKLTRTLPKQLICVATVADILGNRIRIHFDGWPDDFDYWTDITSTNIHPVGWCNKNGRILSPPNNYNDSKGKKPFSWTEYLKETKSIPVPENAFVRRPLRDFVINTTIEVVDLVVPSLIRIAKIVDVRGDELKILYDGFHSNYAYWIEDDSPDIHPVGWSLKTHHPIELPRAKQCLWSCKVIGCNGKGNLNSLINNHIIARDCPYELDSWKKSVAGLAKLPDRLQSITFSNDFTFTNATSLSIDNPNMEKKEKSMLNTISHNSPPTYKGKCFDSKSNEQLTTENISSEDSDESKKLLVENSIENMDYDSLRRDLHLSILGHDVSAFALSKQGRAWTRHSVQLGIPLFNTSDARKWSVQDVANYVDKIVNCSNPYRTTNELNPISQRFIDQEIDGEAFLMLVQEDLMKTLKIPLGQSLKIVNAIIMLRQRISGFLLNDNIVA